MALEPGKSTQEHGNFQKNGESVPENASSRSGGNFPKVELLTTFDEVLAAWVNDITENVEFKPSTIKKYRQWVLMFKRFARHNSRTLVSMTRQDVEEWRNLLLVRHKRSTVDARLCAVSSFYDWLIDNNAPIKANPAAAVRCG